MNKQPHVAVVGATGAVGVEMIKTLEKRNFPVGKLTLLASARSVGKKLKFKGQDITITELTKDSFKGIDIALFSAGGSISKEFAPIAAKAGCVVVDNSSAFRQDDSVPLVVPEINAADVKLHKGIIANPNCTTAITLMALYPLHQAFGCKRIFASSYQAVSGAGVRGIEDLREQTLAWARGEAIVPRFFPHQIAFNLIPHIDQFGADGYTGEERKLMDPGLVEIAEAGARLPLLDYLAAVKEREAIGVAMNLFHRQWDLLLTPTLPIPCTFECPRIGISPAFGRPNMPRMSARLAIACTFATPCTWCVIPIVQPNTTFFPAAYRSAI